jgi:hypothetical protein
MTVILAEPGVIALRDDCPADDAEALLRLLLGDAHAIVDWRGCESAHTAVVQVLVAARRKLRGPPRQGFLSTMVEPGLKRR